jgi:amino acid transporter
MRSSGVNSTTATPVDKKIFLREATGLRKNISALDAFGINLLTVNIGIGILFLAFLAPTSFPGGDMVLGTLLTTAGCIIFALAWAFLAAAMPRLGGDYIYVSRIVNPLLGFLSNWSVVFFSWLFDVVAVYFFVSDALSPSLYALGYMTGNAGLSQLAATVGTPMWIGIIGFLIIVIITAIIILSTTAFMYVVRVIWIVGMIGTIATLVALATLSNSTFITNINAYAQNVAGVSNYYSTVMQTGSGGYVPVNSFSLQTVLIIPLVFFSLGYCFYSSYVGTEVKNVSRSQIWGMSLSVIVSGLFIAGLAWVLQNAVSYQFLYAATNLYFSNATAYALPSAPYINYFAMIGSGNVLVAILIMLGFSCWMVIWMGMGTFLQPRNIMAWSFDRMGPAFLAKVHDRFGTPYWAIIAAFLGHTILFALTFWVTSFILGLSSTLGNVLFTFIPIAIAACIFPYRKKEVFNLAPDIVKKRIGGVPLITILGVITLLFVLLNAVLFFQYAAYGANSAASLEVIAVIIIVGIMWFYIWKYYRKGQGLDLNIAFGQIPPE